MILHSQVKASLTVYDAWLDLQDGFTHIGKGDRRPTSAVFPLTISPKARAATLFSIGLENALPKGMPLLLFWFLFHVLFIFKKTSHMMQCPLTAFIPECKQ